MGCVWGKQAKHNIFHLFYLVFFLFKNSFTNKLLRLYALTTRVLCVDFFFSPLSDPRSRVTVANGQGKQKCIYSSDPPIWSYSCSWLSEFLFKQPSCGGDQTIAHLNCYRVYCLTHTLMGVSAIRSPHQDSKVSPFFHMKLVGTNSHFR